MKTYEVLPGKRVTGQHQVYGEGEKFPESEAFGNPEVMVKDGFVKEVAEPKVEAPKPAEQPRRMSAFDELMAKSDAELAEIAKEYKVEDAEKLAKNKADLVKAIMAKAGYGRGSRHILLARNG